ncbi:MAG: EpsG family protein [Clostridiales bacterium]|nr:EpsG family protein [Clostridiales bacterium]
MTVFHWLVILIVVLSVLMRGDTKGNWKYLLVSVALMYCVFGLRNAYKIGVDTTGPYITRYETVCDRDWENMPSISRWLGIEENSVAREGHERNIALDWTMKLYHEVTKGTYQGFIEFSSMLVMIAFFFYIYRFSTSPVQSILMHFGLLFYTFHFSALKQSLAMSILLFAMGAIIDRKPILFLILVAFASMFHFPALVFLPAYWVANMRLGRGYLVVLAAAFLVTYLMRDQFVDWMTDAYSTQIFDNETRFLANKVIVMLAILFVAVLVRPPVPEDRVYSALLMLTGVATVIQTFAGYNNTFERLADYYFQTSVVFIPMIFEDVKLKRQNLSDDTLLLARRVMPYLICAFAIWRFWVVAVAPGGNLVPYSFYWQ